MSDGGKKLEPSTMLAGRYRIDRVLGRGGMGAVYEATRIDLDRRVAVKLLDEAVDAPQEALAATEREARALARLAHPHIVQIIDFSRGEDGPPFFVMELLAGESLDARLRRSGKIAPGTAALVIVQVLSALAAAHAAEILHRDVKPANVFLTPTAAGFDFVKLLDFGIAGNLSGHATASVRGAALMGTPSYMAPEQIRGMELGPRTDVWGAGVCLYEMLTGALPFDGENLATLLTNICNVAPAPLVDIEPGLAAIVQRALAKDPVARFPSAEAMRTALAPFAAVGAVPSRALGGLPRELGGLPGVTQPVFAEAGATMSSSMPLAATERDPSAPLDREQFASTAVSAPRIETLASGSAHTFGDVPAARPGLDWLPIANGVVALAFVAAIAFMLAPRKEAPLAATKASAPVCSFARIRSWSEGLVDLRIAANAQGMVLAASTGQPAPTFRYASLGEVDEPVDEWPPSLYAELTSPKERIIPCATAGRQLFGGGLRERRVSKEKFWTTFARFPRPNGVIPLGPGGRMDSADVDIIDLDCAAAGDLTIYASLAPYPTMERSNVFLDVADSPRKQIHSESIDLPSRIRIDASREGFGRLIIHNLHAQIGFVDFHTLQADTVDATEEPVEPNEGDVAISGGEADAVWIDHKPRALSWRRYNRALNDLGHGVLASGDVFSPSLAHGDGAVAIAWAERIEGGVRIRVGQGRTARDAALASMPIEVGKSARNIVVAASGERPWVAWLEDGVAQTTRLACSK